MSVHRRSDDGRWLVKWYEGGKEKRRYFGCDASGETLALRFDEQLKRDRGKVPQVSGGLTVADLLQRYHSDHPVEFSTSQSDYYRISRVMIPLVGAIYVEALTSVELNRYVKIRLEAGRKLRTIAREIDLLRAAMSWAESQDPPLVFRNSVRKFKLKHGADEIPHPPTRQEVERLLAVSPPHLTRALIISWACGLRPGGEVFRLTWADVDFEGQELRVISARKGGPVARSVPLDPAMLALLKSWHESDLVSAPYKMPADQIPIVHYRFRPVASVKRSWAHAKKEAKITRRLRPYDLRHAWFTGALKQGGDFKAISELGGHSRVDTTLRFYDHVTGERHRRAVEKIQRITGATIQTLLSGGRPEESERPNDS